ncbi:MAG: hypothetical protein KJ622_00880 [Alphaproteobacteria bacterium]|nr:hypothetical protein [Alphaproteobacteria bacterium]
MTKRNLERQDIVDIGEDYESEKKPYQGIEHRHDGILWFPSAAAGASVALGMNAIVPGSGVAHNANVLLVGVSTFAISYIVNKTLFHTGSKLAATGNKPTIALSAGWFATMAGVFGTISFTGLSHEIVEGAKLRDPAAAMSRAAREVGETTAAAKRVVPLISSARGDMQAIASCEENSGCVSGRRGRGSEVAALEALSAKFASVEKLYGQADRKQADLAAKLQKLASSYEEQLTRGGVGGQSRSKLLAIYDQAQGLATELANVVPTSAANGLANEMRRLAVGTPAGGRIDVGARLRAHADQIEDAIAGIMVTSVTLPPFPPPSGMASGWERIEETWPLALLLFGLEGVLIVLWAMLVFDIRARLAALRQKNRLAKGEHEQLSPDPTDWPADGSIGRRGHQPGSRPGLGGRSNGSGQ